MTTKVTIKNHGPQDILTKVLSAPPVVVDGITIADITRLTVDESVDLYVYDSQTLAVEEIIDADAGPSSD